MIPHWLKGLSRKTQGTIQRRAPRRDAAPKRGSPTRFQPEVEILEDRLAPATINSFSVDPNSGFPFFAQTPITVGSTITVNANWTLSSTGSADIKIDSSVVANSGTLSPATWFWSPGVVLTPPQGAHTVTQEATDTSTATRSVGIIVYSDYTVASSISVNSPVYGQSITFTGDANAVSGAATAGFGNGTEQLWIDGNIVRDTNPLANGVLQFSTANLLPGTHTFFARYFGDNVNYSRGFVFNGVGYQPSALFNDSPTITFTVNAASTTTTLVSSAPSATPGQNVTFTATVAANSPSTFTPTGTVDFFLDTTTAGAPVASGVALSGGVAAWSTSTLALGSHTVIARFNTNSNFSGSVSNTVNESVKAATTTTISSSSISSVFGQLVSFTATVASPTGGSVQPSGTVEFFIDSTTVATGSVTLSGGVASFTTAGLTAGNHFVFASYLGNSQFSAANSPTIIQLVSKADTTTVLTAAPDPSNSGTGIVLTATVGSVLPGTGTPTGTVTFLHDGIPFGTANLVGGTATITTGSGSPLVPALPGGVLSLTAKYNGSSSYNTSTSDPVAEEVDAVATTTFVSSTVNPSVFGQIVTFTATVVAADGETPVGNVTFTDLSDSSKVLGVATLNGGVATLTVSSLNSNLAGHNIRASYPDTGKFVGSSATLTQAINAAQTATTLFSSAPSAGFGEAVTFTANVTVLPPGMGPPTGNVNFVIDNVATSVGLNPSGSAILTISTLGIGSHTVTATYVPNTNALGGTNFLGSSSTAIQQTITQATPTVTLNASPNPASLGAPVTISATVTPLSPTATAPTGTVSFLDGSTVLGTVTIPASGPGAVTVQLLTSSLTVGPHTLTAVYNGDTKYTTATSAPVTETINPASIGTTLAFQASPNPSAFGQSVTFTATITPISGSTVPTGSIIFTDITTSVTLGNGPVNAAGVATVSVSALEVNAAGHVIQATFIPTGTTFAASTATLTQKINPAGTTTTLVSSAPAAGVGQAVTFTATVAVVSPGVGTPTGTVQFFVDNTIVPVATSPLGANGVATFTTSTLSLGNHNVSATYVPTVNALGGTNFAASSSATLLQTVSKVTPTVGVSVVPNPSGLNSSVTISATVTPTFAGGVAPTGTVSFFANGNPIGVTQTIPASSPGPVTVQTTTTALLQGSNSITAVYSGDANYNTATSPPVIETVTGGALTTTTFTANPPSPSVTGQPIVLNASVAYSGPAGGNPGTTPTGTVTFSEGSTVLATVPLNAGAASFTVANPSGGNHTYTAAYSGDILYSPSTATLFQAVQAGQTTTTLTSLKNPGVLNQPVTFSAAVAPVAPASGTPTGTVTFFDNGAPIGTATLVNGVANFTTTSLAKGNHNITATYNGDVNFASSTTSLALQQFISLIPFIFTR